MDKSFGDLSALAESAFRHARPKASTNRPWVAVTPAPADAISTVTWQDQTFGQVPVPNNPKDYASAVGALVGWHAPPGTTTAVVVADVGDGDRAFGGAGSAISVAGVVAFVVTHEGGYAMATADGARVTASPTTAAHALVATWGSVPAPEPELPANAALVSLLLFSLSLNQFFTQRASEDWEPAALAAIWDFKLGDIWNPIKAPLRDLSAESLNQKQFTWEELRGWCVTGLFPPAAEPAVAEWMTVNEFARLFVALTGTPESAAWNVVPFNGVPATRVAMEALCDHAGVPSSYPTYDVGIGAYTQPAEGEAAGLNSDADTGEWPTTLFGVPLTFDHYQAIRQEGRARFIEPGDPSPLEAIVERNNRLHEANTPDMYLDRRVPGGIPSIVTLAMDQDRNAALGLVGLAKDTGMENTPGHKHLLNSAWDRLALTMTAVPYYMPASAAEMIAGSHVPDRDLNEWLRLPHPAVFLCFDHDLLLDEVVAANLDPLAGNPTPYLFPAAHDGTCGGWGSALGELARHGGGVTGVVLLAADDGRLLDTCVWVLHMPEDPRHNMADIRPFRTAWGSISHSAVGYAIKNWAAYAAWGETTSPAQRCEIPPVDDNQAWRKLVRTSAFRKAAATGAAVEGLRIVTLGSADGPAKSTEPGTPTGRTVASHLRRGHWRRQRIATRDATGIVVGDISGVMGDDWHYEGRWIPPVAVKGGGSANTQRVYRLPHVDSEFL